MRAQNEPAWLLHHRPFQDASRILDVLSRNHGRLSLVARGSRSGRSRLKGLLRPFMPLQLSWVARSDLGTLTGADRLGAPVALAGEALMAGYYVNELIIHLVHRHDPQPDIFAAYAATIEGLQGGSQVPARLREFELELLRLLGFALDLGHEADTEASLEPSRHYEYRVEHGPAAAGERTGTMIFTGAELLAIRDRDFADPATLRAATRLLREVIAFHLGGRELKSRKVLLDMHRLGK
ncbi:MAG TPA: DNA repair protein RecO [Woeseiaceae bacterium]|nr:DNA repair protein RecO [Woeseiaceae bacterium]